MVTFQPGSFTITVKSSCPTEEWKNLHQSLVDLIRNVKSDTIVDDTFYSAVDFLIEMMPDYETTQKMGV